LWEREGDGGQGKKVRESEVGGRRGRE